MQQTALNLLPFRTKDFATDADGNIVARSRILNAKDFGAVGDGVTDDGPASNQALDYLASYSVDGQANVNHM